MRFSLRSAIEAFTAVTFAAIGGALVSAEAAAAPVISVNGTDITSGLNCGGTGNVIDCSQPGATFVGNGFSLSNYDFLFHMDPSITSTFTLTNLSAAAQNFTMTVTLPIASIGAPIAITGSAGPGLVQDNSDDGAILTTVPGFSIYTANIFNSPVRTLLDPVQTFTAPPHGATPIGAFSFGPDTLAQSATGSIQILWKFNLTGLDTAQMTGMFDVQAAAVPLPSTITLLGIR